MNVSASTISKPTVCERLARLPTAVVSDVLATMGLGGQVLSSGIRAVAGARPVAGPALCLTGREGPEPTPPAGKSKPVFEMDRRITRGCVAVIATDGHKVGAVIGGNVGISWRVRGCAAVVTDGGVRDVQEFESMGLPVFARFTGPMSNKDRWAFTAVDVPVHLPGQTGRPVAIRSGDIIHCDTDGVVVIPAAHVNRVTSDAEIVEEIEGRIKRDLEGGEDREAVYARYDRFVHIRKISAG